MSKWNKVQKQAIRNREQRDVVKRRKQLATIIKNATILQKVNDGQAAVISSLRKENERLKSIDATTFDFNLKKERKQMDALAVEGFEQVLASRQNSRR